MGPILRTPSVGFQTVRLSLSDLERVKADDRPTFLEIDVGPQTQSPTLPAFSPDYKFLVVPAEGSGDVLVLDLLNLRLHGRVDVGFGSAPWQAKCIPGVDRICYVTKSGFTGDFHASPRERGFVAIIDYFACRTLGEIRVGAGPNGVTVDRQAKRAYVTNIRSDSVTVIDVQSHTVIAEIAVGRGPAFAKLTRSGLLLLVTNLLSSSLSIIRTSTLEVLSEITVGDPSLQEPFPEYGPGDTTGVAISDDDIAYLTNYRSSEIVRLDLRCFTDGSAFPQHVISKSPILYPFFVEVDRASGRILISSGFEKRFALLDGKSGHLIGTFGMNGDGLGGELGTINLWSTLPSENLICCLAPYGLARVKENPASNLVSKFL